MQLSRGSFGELDGNLDRHARHAGRQYDTAQHGERHRPGAVRDRQAGADAPFVRKLERDVASLTANNPYTGHTQKITNYLANPVEEGDSPHGERRPGTNADTCPLRQAGLLALGRRTGCSGPCVQQNTGFAWDHGDYAAEINNNWVGYAGPDVRRPRRRRLGPAGGPSSAGARSGQETVPQQSAGDPGPWVDETDIQPTMLFLAGLHDSYAPDGRVITQILDTVPTALRPAPVQQLSACYKQVDSSVGDFGTDTLQAATSAIESTSSGDRTYRTTMAALSKLERARDQLDTDREERAVRCRSG